MFKSSNGAEMAIEWIMSAHVGEPQAVSADELQASLNEALAYVDAQLRIPARDVLQTARRQRQAALERFGGQMSLFG